MGLGLHLGVRGQEGLVAGSEVDLGVKHIHMRGGRSWQQQMPGQTLCPLSVLSEPHFVQALEYGDHVYFFFREVSVEDARLGRVRTWSPQDYI